MRAVSSHWSIVSKSVFWLAVSAMFFVLCGSVDAQQPSKIPTIGWLTFRPLSEASLGAAALRRELRALGYIEGKNIAIVYRSAEGRPERFPTLADELVRLKVDVLLTPGTPAALAAKNATRTIPIVFTAVADPTPTGLVDSLPRPGGNITGFTEISEVLAGKRLELLKESIAKLSRVAVLWNPRNPGNAQQWKESQVAARELGLQLYSIEVSSADKYDGAIREAANSRYAALAVAQDSLVQFNLKRIADLSIKNRLPAIYPRPEFVDNGGLMSYGPSPDESYKRVASMVDKILKGTKPADIPVEQPTKFEFAINLKTAKQIGLTIPPNVLARADKVIR
jgi:putative tryptophan/tyrosine transport system substrate-binding protein